MTRILFIDFLIVASAVACSSDGGTVASDAGGPVDLGVDSAHEDDGGDSGPPELAESAPGRWYGGDLHVHATGASNDTGGDSFPGRIKEVAVARGLDWLVLTDHSNSTGSDPTTTDEDPDLFNMGPEFPYWETAQELTDEGFLFIDGNEISPVAEGESGPTGHVGCAPRDLETFDVDYVFTDRPRGTVTGGEALEQAHEAGCFATLNHPYGLAPWTAYDWTSFDYDAVEVYNGTGGWDAGDANALKGWACDLAAGRRPTLVAGSDNHRIEIEPPGSLLNPPLAWPTVWVRAESLAWSEIIAGLESGRVSVTDDGAPMELDAFDAEGDWLGMMGDDVPASELEWLRLSGDVGSSEARVVRLYRIGLEQCEDPRAPQVFDVPEPGWEVVWEETVEDGESFDETIRVEAEPGHFFFVYKGPESMSGILHYGVGLTNAIGTVE